MFHITVWFGFGEFINVPLTFYNSPTTTGESGTQQNMYFIRILVLGWGRGGRLWPVKRVSGLFG